VSGRTTQVPAPREDAEVPAYLEALGIPGLADVHVHFHPDRLTERIWGFFDEGERHYGMAWPIVYRTSATERLRTLRALGVHDVPALTYAHKAGMAESINRWCAKFAEEHPGVLRCATLYPEPGMTEQVAAALEDGLQLVKVHVSVSDLAPDDDLLGGSWELLARARVPVVIHAGSGPRVLGRGAGHTGPAALRRLLTTHPELTLVVAHLGMPEYDGFADLVERYPRVHLDTTMAGTDFMERTMPVPRHFVGRLGELRERVVLGSDFPNIPYAYAHQLEALHRWELGDDWLRDVLWHNGRRLLGLDV
jgi:hypothetical protein